MSVGPVFPAGAAAPRTVVSIPSQTDLRNGGLPDVTATKTDSLLIDLDGDTLPDPGDTLRYTVVVTNTGTGDALGVVLSDTLDANTQLTGTVQASPLAISDVYTATEDTALVVTALAGVLLNDFGQPAPSAVPQAAAATTQGGSVTLNANGSFTYNPPAGFVGLDSFNYDAANPGGADTGLVAVNVFALPVAIDDGYSTVQDTPLVVPAGSGVLTNDTPNGAAISGYAAVTSEGGAVSLALDGGFTYTPTAGFYSPPTDTFTYTLSNAVGSSTATVTLTVDLPGPPIAVDDAYTATANTDLTVPAAGVLANDTVNSATISDYQAASSQGGTVTLSPDGSFVYTPATDSISPPADTFTYTLSNALGDSTAMVTLTVQPPGPPVAVDDAYTATANTPLNVPAAGVFGNDTLNFAVLTDYAATTAQGGAVAINPDGSFVYTPTQDYVSPPTDSFTYTVSNVLGNATATVILTVQPPGPPVAVADVYTTTVNTPLTVPADGVLANDTENFAAITSFQALTSQGGSVTLAADGSFVYTPTNNLVSPPTDSFTYTLSNALGESTAAVTITVYPAGPPVAAADSYTATVNTPLTVPPDGVLGNDTLNVGVIAEYQALTAQGGAVSLNPDGSFVYTPTTDFLSPPTDSFTYTLTNTVGADMALVTITVLPPAAPNAVDDSYATTANTPLMVAAASGVLNNDTTHFAVISGYQAATSEGGTVALAADGGFVYTPTADFVSPPTDSFTYTLTNALGSDTAVVTITVAPPGAPVATDDSYTTTVDTDRVIAATGVLGNDLTNFAVISAYAATTTRGGSVVLAATGAFTYTPPAGVVSPPVDTFTYTLSNALGNSTATVTFTIFPAAPPVAVDDLYTTTVNTDLLVPTNGVLGNDTLHFGAIVDYAATTNLGGSVVLAATGAFTYTPPADTVRPPNDSFTYTLTNTLGSDTATVTLAIDPPGPPIAVDDTYTATASTVLNVPAVGVLGNDTVNFATLTDFQAATARGGTVVLDALGAFTYTAPAEVSPPDDTFTYTLSNALGDSTATVTLELFPPAPPVAVNDTYTATANTQRSFAAGVGVLSNDTPHFGAVTDYQASTVGGGSVVVAASGAFTYTPPADTISPPDDAFTYTVSNALGSDTATVAITLFPPPPVAVSDSYTATGNLTLTVPVSGVLTNDTLNWATLASASSTSAQGGDVAVSPDGSFTYLSAPGFEGTDTFTYTLTNATASDTATVTVTVDDVIWFVDNTAAPAGDGRLGSPFDSLSAFQTANLDQAGDVIFIYQGTGNYAGGLALQNNQALIGQGVALSSALTALGLTPAPGSAALPGATTNPLITNALGHGLTLASTNTVRGVNLGTSEPASFALTGSGLGTLTVNSVAISSSAGGLSLTTGTANVTLDSLTATGGLHGVFLSGIAGTLNFVTGSVSGASGATLNVVGGTAAVTYGGSLNQANNAALVRVAGAESGSTLTFSGSLGATNGTGLVFDNADGTYTFNGTTTLNGGDAGIDILNGSSGTFSFSSATSITNPSGTAFNLDASPASVTYSGSLSAGTGLLVDINNHDGGTLTFQTGTFSSTGQGVRVQNSNAGTISFDNPAKTLTTGANPAIALSNNGGSTINFGNGGLALTTTSGVGFSATGGTVNVTGANNTIATATGTAALLSGTGGTLVFRSLAVNGAPHGLSLTNTTGSFEVTGDGASDPANTTRGRITARQGGGSLALGSGGTLAATTNAAVLLNNAANVTLRNMTLTTAGGSVNDGRDGIRATNASSLTLDNLLIDGNGNGLANNSGLDGSGLVDLTILHTEILRTATTPGVESVDVWAVNLANLTGSASLSHSIFDTARENVVGLVQTGSATLSLAVTNSLFQNANIAAVGNNGLGISAANTANVSVTVADSDFLHFYGNGFQYVGVDQSGGGRLWIENSTFDDDGTSINIAHQGQDTTLQFDIQNNAIRASGIAPGVPGNALNAINLLLGEPATAGSVLEGYLTGNTIGHAATLSSGSAQGNGISVATYGGGTLTLLADSNTIRQIEFDHAFWASASKQSDTAGNATVNLTLTNNDFRTDTSGSGLAGLGITAGAGGYANENPTICANLLGNTAFIGDTTYFGIDLTLTGLLGSVPVVQLVGYGGADNDAAAVEAFLSSAAVATNVSPAADVTQHLGTITTAVNCATPGFTQGSVQVVNRLLAAQPNTLMGARAMPARSSGRARLVGTAPALATDSVLVDLGPLPAGKAVTITFDVVIVKPVPAGTTEVSNQALVSGSNFASVLTDDPDTVAAGDPTVTVLAPPEVFTLFLPLVTGNYASRPDLVGSFSLSPNQTAFGPGEPVLITVVITNTGTAPAHGFWVDFYINPSSAPAQGSQPWDTLCGLSPCYGLAWRVDSTLNPGESLTLTSAPGSYWAPNTIWPGHFAAGTADLYLYVDSFSNPSAATGAVLESNENNNRAELHGLSVPAAAGAQSGDDPRRPEDLPER